MGYKQSHHSHRIAVKVEYGIRPLLLIDVTLHWKFWIRLSSRIQWIHWNTAGSLKICTAFHVPSFKVHGIHVRMQTSCFLSQAIVRGSPIYRLSPLHDTLPITTINLLQAIDFWYGEIWVTLRIDWFLTRKDFFHFQVIYFFIIQLVFFIGVESIPRLWSHPNCDV
jgi:hypothetical protein